VRVPAISALILAAALALTPAGAQQSSDPPPEKTFSESVEVRVVNVDVRVTDRKGRPVQGLTRDDFKLFEDGEEVKITNFSELGEEPEEGAPRQAPEPAAAPEPPTTLAAPGEPPPQVAIFLDHLHLDPGGRGRLLAGLEAFVQGLAPDVPVLVAAQAGGFAIASPPTTDRQKTLAALRGQAKVAGGAVLEDRERRSAMARMRELLEQYGGCERALPDMIAVAREYGGQVSDNAHRTVDGLGLLVASLRGLPGEKVVLLGSDGFALRPSLGLLHYIADLCPQNERDVAAYYQEDDLSGDYLHLAADAAANRVTFYSLEATGLTTDADVTEGLAGDRPGVSYRPSVLTKRVERANVQHSLFLLADETGGRPVFNANRFEAPLEEVAGDVGTRYSLGFVPAHRGDGQVHHLEVEVAGHTHGVRYRKTYRDKPVEERVAESMMGTLLFGHESNSLAVKVSVNDTGEGGDGGGAGHEGERAAKVRIEVPLSSITLEPGAGFSVGRLRLVLTAGDGAGHWGPIKEKMAPVRVPSDEDVAGGHRVFEVAIDLPPGPAEVAVGVRDEISGTGSYVRRRLEAPASDSSSRHADSPSP
jgi:VWFA-related protein